MDRMLLWLAHEVSADHRAGRILDGFVSGIILLAKDGCLSVVGLAVVELSDCRAAGIKCGTNSTRTILLFYGRGHALVIISSLHEDCSHSTVVFYNRINNGVIGFCWPSEFVGLRLQISHCCFDLVRLGSGKVWERSGNCHEK